VFDEAVVPQREVGEFVGFGREVVFDVDHAALGLWSGLEAYWDEVGEGQ
jgi:hypothetical protein